MSHITDNDYRHAKKIWDRLTPEGERTTLGDYHDMYLLLDSLLLGDVFDNFRDTCLDKYGLDPSHFLTAPGLSWQAALKMTGVKLELMTDLDMLLMFEQGIRGGITQAVHRYAKANNPYMGDQYNPKKESSYIQYLRCEQFYGWAMSQPLPIGDFQWVKDVNSITSDMINQLSKDEASWIPSRG